ncbi:MAG: Tn3 family transposase [Pseudonocardiales bacterium]|nr:Tn3 family transposase [Pseudonocardiales bacterium]
MACPGAGQAAGTANRQALHAEVTRRWGTIDSLDFLKETDYHTGFTDAFSSVATRETTPRRVIRKRLLLVLHSMGINIGSRGSPLPVIMGRPRRHCAPPGSCSSTAIICARPWRWWSTKP